MQCNQQSVILYLPICGHTAGIHLLTYEAENQNIM